MRDTQPTRPRAGPVARYYRPPAHACSTHRRGYERRRRHTSKSTLPSLASLLHTSPCLSVVSSHVCLLDLAAAMALFHGLAHRHREERMAPNAHPRWRKCTPSPSRIRPCLPLVLLISSAPSPPFQAGKVVKCQSSSMQHAPRSHRIPPHHRCRWSRPVRLLRSAAFTSR